VSSFALIACDHGFGHVRRCLLIARELVARAHTVTLFAPRRATDRFNTADAIDLVDFATGTTVEGLRGGDALASAWADRLPSLDHFDVVVSDNLPEVLDIRPDAVLSGSFFWHLVLDGIDARIAERAETLLRTHHPRMIGSTIFAMPELEARTQLRRVGLCVSGPPPSVPGDALLVACGGTRAMEAPFASLLRQVARRPQPPFSTVFVEPRLIPADAPPWMLPATFDATMYCRLSAAVCRAGVGTMTECAWARARVFSVGEAGNAEVTFNAARFTELGLGESALAPDAAFDAACGFVSDPQARAQHLRAALEVDLDGVRETVDFLTAR